MALTGRAFWLNLLSLVDPRVTKQVDSFGRIVNQADVMTNDVNNATRLGRAYRAFWRGQIPADSAFYFSLVPPPGIKIIGISRVTQVEGGRVESRFAVADGFGTTEETIVGHNFDETLEDQAQSSLLRVTGPTNLSYRDSGAPIVSPTTGAARLPSVQTQVGADPKFDLGHLPVFEYKNPSETTPVELWLDIAWEEEPGDPV